MGKIFVEITKTFVDGHNEYEVGNVSKFITTDKNYLEAKSGVYYRYDDEFCEHSIIDENDLEGGADGYHTTIYSVDAREVSDEESEKINTIIKEYDNL